MSRTQLKSTKPRSMPRKSTSEMSEQSMKNKKKRNTNSSKITEMRSRLLMNRTQHFHPSWKTNYFQTQHVSKMRRKRLTSLLRSGQSSKPISRNSLRNLNSSKITIPAPHVPNPSQRRRKSPISWKAKQKLRNLMPHWKLLRILWEDETRYWHPLKNK